jgi:hypothetical protein
MWRNVHGDWLVTAKAGLEYICARSPRDLPFDVVRQEGMVALMEALDLFSVNLNQTSNLARPGDNLCVMYQEKCRQMLRMTVTAESPMTVHMAVRIHDKDGEMLPVVAPPVPPWHRSFRYYRLSQLAVDVYEAYRNLYLAFEALMASRYPRDEKEREGNWIRRCFHKIHLDFDVSDLGPMGHRLPNEYLFGILYESTRCNLFHAQRIDAILPYYEVDAPKIHAAYQLLLNIWRRVACRTLQISVAGGVITYAGYHAQMNLVLGGESKLAFMVSNDPTTVRASDTEVGGGEYQVRALQACTYLGESTKGTVKIAAHDGQPASLPKIFRFALQVDKHLHFLGAVSGGLSLVGIDDFQVFIEQRLLQGNQPKARF